MKIFRFYNESISIVLIDAWKLINVHLNNHSFGLLLEYLIKTKKKNENI